MENKIQTITKYQQVADLIEQEIKLGRYIPGTKLPSERDLAKRYGISHMTVNKALSLLVAKKMLKRVHGNGTFIIGDHAFISSKLIMVAIPAEIHNHPLFYPDLTNALQDTGFFTILLNTDAENISESFWKVLEQQPKACVIDPPRDMVVKELTGFKGYENIIFIHKPIQISDNHTFSVIYTDYISVGYEGMKALFSHNRKNILVLGYEKEPDGIINLFCQGCEKAMNEFEVQGYHFLDTNKVNETEMENLFIDKKFDGIFSLGDFRAIPYLKIFHKLGVKIPEDVEIVGTYNTPWADTFGITSICINQKQIIDEVINCLKENLKGHVKKISPYIVFRNSCPK
ncbi:MAG TPA: GntR family transcriptional regulator [bacterium]|nr:GntR family transcriptional regulator [bacterium]